MDRGIGAPRGFGFGAIGRHWGTEWVGKNFGSHRDAEEFCGLSKMSPQFQAKITLQMQPSSRQVS